MLGRLFLLFTVVPIVELYLLIQIGERVGALPTIGVVIATGATGAWLARREGRRALEEIQTSVARGELPDDPLLAGLLVLVGGVLLITPGVITDVFGLGLLIPPVRRLVARVVRRRLGARMQVVGFGTDALGGGFGGTGGVGFGVDDRGREVIDVEAHVHDGQSPSADDVARG